jgi:hypothetical protein
MKRRTTLEECGVENSEHGKVYKLEAYTIDFPGRVVALRLFSEMFPGPIWYLSDSEGFNALTSMDDYEKLEATYKSFKQGEEA